MASGAAARTRTRVRTLRILPVGLALTLGQGCYVYTPVLGSPEPPAYLALDLSDQGRVGLGGLIGPAATRVEGVLRSETDSGFALSVSAVEYLNGQSNRWSGEPLTLQKNFVANVRERRFSRGRTALATGGALGGILLFAVTRGLLGAGSEAPGDPLPDPGEQ